MSQTCQYIRAVAPFQNSTSQLQIQSSDQQVAQVISRARISGQQLTANQFDDTFNSMHQIINKRHGNRSQ